MRRENPPPRCTGPAGAIFRAETLHTLSKKLTLLRGSWRCLLLSSLSHLPSSSFCSLFHLHHFPRRLMHQEIDSQDQPFLPFPSVWGTDFLNVKVPFPSLPSYKLFCHPSTERCVVLSLGCVDSFSAPLYLSSSSFKIPSLCLPLLSFSYEMTAEGDRHETRDTFCLQKMYLL